MAIYIKSLPPVEGPKPAEEEVSVPGGSAPCE